LAVIPGTKKYGVAAVIHGVSGSDHTVHLQRPAEVFEVSDFDGADLHGLGVDSVYRHEPRRAVRKQHRTE
jgi:hypothetical protein